MSERTGERTEGRTDRRTCDGTDAWTGGRTCDRTDDWTGGQAGDRTDDWTGGQACDGTDAWTGGQACDGTDAWTGGQASGRTDDWTGGQASDRTDAWTGGQASDRTDAWTGGQASDRMDAWTGGQARDRTDAWTGGQASDRTDACWRKHNVSAFGLGQPKEWGSQHASSTPPSTPIPHLPGAPHPSPRGVFHRAEAPLLPAGLAGLWMSGIGSKEGLARVWVQGGFDGGVGERDRVRGGFGGGVDEREWVLGITAGICVATWIICYTTLDWLEVAFKVWTGWRLRSRCGLVGGNVRHRARCAARSHTGSSLWASFHRASALYEGVLYTKICSSIFHRNGGTRFGAAFCTRIVFDFSERARPLSKCMQLFRLCVRPCARCKAGIVGCLRIHPMSLRRYTRGGKLQPL
eukprot:366370-Chlamydomonas_euryale.AAC.11